MIYEVELMEENFKDLENMEEFNLDRLVIDILQGNLKPLDHRLPLRHQLLEENLVQLVGGAAWLSKGLRRCWDHWQLPLCWLLGRVFLEVLLEGRVMEVNPKSICFGARKLGGLQVRLHRGLQEGLLSEGLGRSTRWNLFEGVFYKKLKMRFSEKFNDLLVLVVEVLKVKFRAITLRPVPVAFKVHQRVDFKVNNYLFLVSEAVEAL